jgi:hypothetical protein
LWLVVVDGRYVDEIIDGASRELDVVRRRAVVDVDVRICGGPVVRAMEDIHPVESSGPRGPRHTALNTSWSGARGCARGAAGGGGEIWGHEAHRMQPCARFYDRWGCVDHGIPARQRPFALGFCAVEGWLWEAVRQGQADSRIYGMFPGRCRLLHAHA